MSWTAVSPEVVLDDAEASPAGPLASVAVSGGVFGVGAVGVGVDAGAAVGCLVGISVGVRRRMKSLMPAPYGVGRRNNYMKRQYVLDNYQDIIYRTISTAYRVEAEDIERSLLYSGRYIYNT